MYESFIQPILLYGSDVWGVKDTAGKALDKILLWFLRIMLRVKATTSNLVTLGECGVIPPAVKCHINVLLYFQRLSNSPDSSILKRVFRESQRLHDLGFTTWYSRVWNLALEYGITNLTNPPTDYNKRLLRNKVTHAYKQTWLAQVQNLDKNPILRTYNQIKFEYKCEPYLNLIKIPKYRIAFSRFRAGSHSLEIERGRYTNPKTPVEDRLC